jgi:tetratricopeptide (TPR) repeat protein
VALAPDYAVARGTLSMGLSVLYQQTGFRDHALLAEAVENAETALALNSNNATVLFQVVHTFGNAQRFSEGLQLAERAVEINPTLLDPRQVLALCLNHFERYEEALAQLAEGDRLAPRSFQQPGSEGHRSWAYYGLGRVEEALASIRVFARAYPNQLIALLTEPVVLRTLGRNDEAQDAIRRARKAWPGEGLDFWLGFARGTYLSETMFHSFSRHFTSAWISTPA